MVPFLDEYICSTVSLNKNASTRIYQFDWLLVINYTVFSELVRVKNLNEWAF